MATFIVAKFVEERNLLSVVYKSWEEVVVFSSKMVASMYEAQQLKARE
jgi:hypothetical protein